MNTNIRWLVGGVFALVLLGACHGGESIPVTREQAVGMYVVRYHGVDDTLWVNRDGSFQHRLWDAKGLAVTEQGRWTMSAYPDGDVALEFDRITPAADKDSPRYAVSGVWLARVGRDGDGPVTIILNRDLDLSYVRRDSSHSDARKQ